MKAGMKGEFGSDGVVRDIWAGLTIDPGSLVQLHLREISKNHILQMHRLPCCSCSIATPKPKFSIHQRNCLASATTKNYSNTHHHAPSPFLNCDMNRSRLKDCAMPSADTPLIPPKRPPSRTKDIIHLTRTSDQKMVSYSDHDRDDRALCLPGQAYYLEIP